MIKNISKSVGKSMKLGVSSGVSSGVSLSRIHYSLNQTRRMSSNHHPNIENNTVANLSGFPPIKRNTIINFGRQGTHYVVERFGKFSRVEPPGLFFTVPFIERIYAVDMRQIVIDVDRQNAFTSDNVAVSVAAQLYVNVKDLHAACYKVQQPLVAVVSQAQSALRTAIGKNDLDHLLKDRNTINLNVADALHGTAEQWGVEVCRFEITELTPDKNIQAAMDLQSTAERERRAVVTSAEGRRRAMELEAEGKRLAIELEATAKKKAVELEAEAMKNAAKSLENIDTKVLDYWIKNMHIKMVGELAKNNKNTLFIGKDISKLPMLVDNKDI